MNLESTEIETFEYISLLNWAEKFWRTHLPWRNLEGLDKKTRGYHVWLSEIFLQQTQAERVIPFYERVLQTFPTVDSLAKISYEEFFPYYSGLGYYSRARNLLACARIMVEKYNSIFPKDSLELQALPGIWPYTAEAIRAFAYNIPTLSFDTNLEKIFSRYYHGSRFLKLSREEKEIILWQFQGTWLSSQKVNGALMDFATILSKNSKGWINFENYPLENCLFWKTKWALEIETKKPIRYFPTKDAQVEVILHKNHVVYYSSRVEKYEPFFLPPTEDDIRKYVQNYFRTEHNLEVSIRPPHKKEYRNDIPFVSMYAQVQMGEVRFGAFQIEKTPKQIKKDTSIENYDPI